MTKTTVKRYKVTSPVRFFLFILICVMTITFGIYSVLSRPSEAAAEPSIIYKEVTVRENDTLWSIAGEFGPDGKDVRDVINEICDYNGITANDISCGDTIYVPVEAAN